MTTPSSTKGLQTDALLTFCASTIELSQCIESHDLFNFLLAELTLEMSILLSGQA